MRSLDTLWSLVCAKGGGGECPRTEVQRSAEPFGSIAEGQKGRKNSGGTRGRRLIEKGFHTNNRNKIHRSTAPRSEGGWWICVHLSSSFFPQRKSSVDKDQ